LGYALFFTKWHTILQISGGNYPLETFKKPLSSEEEKLYLSRCHKGCNSARNVLIEYNLRLVAHIVKKYSSSFRDSEELLSVGTIGLIKAIDTYKIQKGTRFSSYASRCIENEILMTLRQEKKKFREVSMYEPVGCDREGNEITLMEVLPSQKNEVIDDIIRNESLTYLPACMFTCLNQKEQKIISMRYGLNGYKVLTQREIAAKLKISRSYVSRIEKKALEKLKECLE
jgi:RNA polymerase sporulation-specific sigma factor